MKKLLKRLLPITLASSFIVAIPATISADSLATNDSTSIITIAASEKIVRPTVKWSKKKIYDVNISDPNSTLNVRSGPGTNYSTVGYLYSYDWSIFNGENGDGTWYHMCNNLGDSLGWVKASYLKFNQYYPTE